MSELMNTEHGNWTYRRQLLTTVSALALLITIYESGDAGAADQDADRPTTWIELGGQFERMDNAQENFSPPFVASITQANLQSALDVQKPSIYAIGGDGKISFQPEDSNWFFSVSVQYGRSQESRHRHQQTKNAYFPIQKFQILPGKYYGGYTAYPAVHAKFADGVANQNESHGVVDFQAGKDVGLGMFGNRGSSMFGAGVRFAQFSSKSDVSLHAQPDLQYPVPTKPITSLAIFRSQFKYAPVKKFHGFMGIANSQRDFQGVGPSVSWNASQIFVGSPQSGGINFDWGANAAILFGRQRAEVHHQTTAKTYQGGRAGPTGTRPGNIFGYGKLKQVAFGSPFGHQTSHNAIAFNRVRTVVVPNFGGFVGLSFLYSNAKLNFGYRADFFLGAMDGGFDIAKKENRSFYGPFASISVGFGG